MRPQKGADVFLKRWDRKVSGTAPRHKLTEYSTFPAACLSVSCVSSSPDPLMLLPANTLDGIRGSLVSWRSGRLPNLPRSSAVIPSTRGFRRGVGTSHEADRSHALRPPRHLLFTCQTRIHQHPLQP